MKLVIYNEEKDVIDVTEYIEDPEISGNDIEWLGGSMTDVKLPFILLADDVEVGDKVTKELLVLDEKDEYTKIDLYEENRRLRAINNMNSMAIMELAQIVLGGE